MNNPNQNILFAKRRVHRKRKSVFAAPVAPLTLVSATLFTDDGAYVILTFDRAVSTAGINLVGVNLVAHALEGFYVCSSGMSVEATTVRLDFSLDDTIPAGPDILLNVPGTNGIVAVDDGAAWAGVTDLEIPFP